MQVLDLGNNKIKDTFPPWLETLPELQVLVLRSNKLHSFLPSPMTLLTMTWPGLYQKGTLRT
ncbi:receptor-like protein 12 [Gossypium australe]|uniref:Receptor-like protein 12 n=1 Tax=Gossypium australe TaxID=47621 RepID=A0A5B6VE68_9ROSI|nr:receptor-like protein 12 [Gossypium australe]